MFSEAAVVKLTRINYYMFVHRSHVFDQNKSKLNVDCVQSLYDILPVTTSSTSAHITNITLLSDLQYSGLIESWEVGDIKFARFEDTL